MKILLSAYACEPHKGSEPGVGWNWALEIAKHHEVWVITRANNKRAIEKYLNEHPIDNLHFIYYDLPKYLRFWKKGNRGVQLYYYLWQIGIYKIVKRLNKAIKFDVIHHVTFGKYWTPSFLSLLPVKFIWGPVGGGESMPRAFYPRFNFWSAIFEYTRNIARWLGEHDPFVRATASNSILAFAATKETAERLYKIGCKNVQIVSQVAFTKETIQTLSNQPHLGSEKFRVISIGRPLYWKGFYLGLKAFALANIENSEYWLIANGNGKQNLINLSKRLKISDKVTFFDRLPQLTDIYNKIGECDVLIHPALHEAFGTVVLEALTIGKPVICLDLGGPALQVTAETGFKIPAHSPEQVIRDMAEAMKILAENPELRKRMGEAGRRRVMEHFTWEKKGAFINEIYRKVLAEREAAVESEGGE